MSGVGFQVSGQPLMVSSASVAMMALDHGSCHGFSRSLHGKDCAYCCVPKTFRASSVVKCLVSSQFVHSADT